MKIIISPSKTMKACNKRLDLVTKPLFIHQALELVKTVETLSNEEIKKAFEVSNKIAIETKDYFEHFQKEGYTQAIYSYTGVQYKALDFEGIQNKQYLIDHLCILSGLYGFVLPTDLISLYRYDFLNNPYPGSLYQFWSNLVYNEIIKNNETILNLASLEYAKLIEPFLTEKNKMINVYFYTKKQGSLKEVSVTVKKARGLIVHYMAENNIQEIEKIKEFNLLGFHYSKDLSNEFQYVFIQEE